MSKTEFIFTEAPDPHIQRRRDMLKKYPDQIRALMGNYPLTFLWILFCVGSQFSIAYALRDHSWGLIAATAFCVGAFFNHALYVFIHEATHNLVFKHSLANRIVGLICDLPLVAPASQAFRKYHLIHHNRQGQHEFDADLASEAEADLVGNHWFKKLIWVFLMAVSQASRPSRLKIRPFMNGWMAFNLVFQAAVMVGFYQVAGVKGIVYLLASTVIGLGLHPLGGRWIAEHFVIKEGQETYSYYGPLNLVIFNVGYHNEHHDVMTIAWKNLPKLTKTAPEFYDSLVSHPSYPALLYRFITDPSMSLKSRVLRPNVGAEEKAQIRVNKIHLDDGITPELA